MRRWLLYYCAVLLFPAVRCALSIAAPASGPSPPFWSTSPVAAAISSESDVVPIQLAGGSPSQQILQCSAQQECAECAPAGDCGACGNDCSLPAVCDDCPNYGFMAFLSYDSFRGVADQSWQNNGVVTGFNFGSRLGVLSDLTGIGFQIGGSIGVYDWSGTDYRLQNQNLAETQGFFTFGLFRRATDTSKWNIGVVQDYMYNNNFGVLGQNPMLSQMRGQLGYCTSASNEFGVWGAWRVLSSGTIVQGNAPVRYAAVQQLNAYWHHKWTPGGGDTWFWVGRPEQSRLTRDGSLGEFIAGASGNVPLNDRVALFALAEYMHPSARPGPQGSEEEQWNFTIGLAFYPKPNARSRTVAGRCWMPLMPVANNGLFLVDTSGLGPI